MTTSPIFPILTKRIALLDLDHDVVNTATLPAFLMLTKLAITTKEKPNTTLYLCPWMCLAMLRSAPNLAECIFAGMRFQEFDPNTIDDYDPDGDDSYEQEYEELIEHTHYTHNALKTLRLGKPLQDDPSEEWNNSCILLKHITLPALETLVVSDLDIDWVDFTGFIQRSSPPLHTLYLPASPRNVADIERLLQDLPTLTHVELCSIKNIHEHGILTSLHNIHLIPHLQHLTIWGHFSEEWQYEQLLPLLQRIKLQCFKLFLSSPSYGSKPSAERIMQLREIRMHKKEIHIGPCDTNYLDLH